MDWLKDAIDRMEQKIDKLDTRVDNIDVTMATNTQELIEHKRRTEINENNLELLRKEFEPIKRSSIFINILAKVIAFTATIIAAIKGFHFLK